MMIKNHLRLWISRASLKYTDRNGDVWTQQYDGTWKSTTREVQTNAEMELSILLGY